jgi:predicted HTH transcriptional regulator
MTKMTYVEALAIAINALEDAEAVEKLEALKAQLEKRNASRGQTKTQKANEGLKAEILAFVGEAGAVRAGNVATHFGVSGQKASALLNQLVKAEALEKFAEKKVTFFKVAEA